MTTNNKILLGLGALAAVAAYFVFKKAAASVAVSKPQCGENEVPCANGNGCYDIRAKYSHDPCDVSVKGMGADVRTFPSDITQTVASAQTFANYVNTKQNKFFRPEIGKFSAN